jgi:hypothetical protein
LTPSERRIAQLAAHGLSNPEIAQALFATLRTRPKATEDYTKVDIAGVERPGHVTRGGRSQARYHLRSSVAMHADHADELLHRGRRALVAAEWELARRRALRNCGNWVRPPRCSMA